MIRGCWFNRSRAILTYYVGVVGRRDDINSGKGNEHGVVIEGWLWGECSGLDENAF